MHLSIQLDQRQTTLQVHPYQSFYSIFCHYQSLESSIRNYDISDFDFIYHKQHIPTNSSLCCDALEIPDYGVIELHPKMRGGGISDFLKFFKKHWGYVILALLIAVIPLFTLPSGLIPISAALLKVVLDETFETLGLYLATNFGKYSLYNRFKFIISFLKYVIFILIVYVSITFPLLILTCIFKGKDLLDNPKGLCSPSNAAFITGIVLTTLYMFIYTYFRGFGNLLDWIKSFFKQDQTSQMTLAPATEALHRSYNKAKYVAVSRNPMLNIYYMFLDNMADVSMVSLNSIIDMGCKGNFNTSAFINKFERQMNRVQDQTKDLQEDGKRGKIQIEIPSDRKVECCIPENYEKIGTLFYQAINKMGFQNYLMKAELYSPMILLAITFLEKACQVPGSDQHHISTLLCSLEERLKAFSDSNHQAYVPSNEGFYNQFLKAFFFSSMCNLFTLAQNTNVTIQEMGGMYDVIDMLKSGSATGYYIAWCYGVCLIALIICGLFDIY